MAKENTIPEGLTPYRIAITETYVKEVVIYAENSNSGLRLADELRSNGEIQIDYENYAEGSIESRGIARPIDLELHDVYGLDHMDEQAAWQVGPDRILTIQTCEDGFDYTLYDQNYRDIDGGQLDCPEMSMLEARTEILKSFGLDNQDLQLLVYEDVLSNIDKALFSQGESYPFADQKPSLDAQIRSVAHHGESKEVRDVVMESDKLRNMTLDVCYKIPGYKELPLEDKNKLYDMVKNAVSLSFSKEKQPGVSERPAER